MMSSSPKYVPNWTSITMRFSLVLFPRECLAPRGISIDSPFFRIIFLSSRFTFAFPSTTTQCSDLFLWYWSDRCWPGLTVNFFTLQSLESKIFSNFPHGRFSKVCSAALECPIFLISSKTSLTFSSNVFFYNQCCIIIINYH